MRVNTGYHANTTDDGTVPAFPNTVRRPQLWSADGTEWAGTVTDVDEFGAGAVWTFRPGHSAVVVAPLLFGFRATEPCVVTFTAGTVTAVRPSGVGDVVTLDDVRHEVGVVAWDVQVVT